MPDTRLCSIPDCGKPHYARGWCDPHYKKWNKYGDPLVGGHRATKGAPLAWILQHIKHQSDECLIWPFARNAWGYGDLWVEENGTRKHVRANRFMCTLAHGEPPTPSHEALHNCGNGHLACTNPKHLRWGTSEDNSADTIAHGNSCRGEQKPNAKLTRNDVLKIRELLAGGLSQSKVAKQFGVGQQTICDIKRKRLWGWL